MKIQLLFSSLVLIIFSCQKSEKVKLVKGESGIYYEEFDSLYRIQKIAEGVNPYNIENEIYSPGKEYIFDYVYIDSNKVKYRFALEGYRLTPYDSIDHQTILEASFWIDEGMNAFSDMPDYIQSEMKYEFYLPNRNTFFPKSTSGLIENRKNIWFHPFRNPRYFRMLNLNPYPFIQKPYKIGNKWKWTGMKVGGSTWTDIDWKIWEGAAEFVHSYEIVREENLKTNFGDLKCFVINAIGESRIGNTGLKSYFNQQFGFVRLEYDNINKSKMVLNLIEVRDKIEK